MDSIKMIELLNGEVYFHSGEILKMLEETEEFHLNDATGTEEQRMLAAWIVSGIRNRLMHAVIKRHKLR